MEDDTLIQMALAEARRAAEHDDVPIGAVLVMDGELLASRHNERELRGDPTAHAEMLVLQDAADHRGGWRLDGATVAVTLEPCPMCAGAMVNARISRLVYGADDPKAGACGSLYNLGADPRLNHEYEVRAGVRAEECAELLTDFFGELRSG